MQHPHYVAKTIETPIGKLRLVASDKGLCAVQFNGGRGVKSDFADAVESETNSILNKAEKQLGEYFAGGRSAFDVKLDLKGTMFQLMAWKALQAIPYGQTISYGDQAKKVGDAKKARAVGMANNRNPVPIIVPCHRVVGADGRLVGFGGGLEVKEYLLALEAKTLPKAKRVSV